MTLARSAAVWALVLSSCSGGICSSEGAPLGERSTAATPTPEVNGELSARLAGALAQKEEGYHPRTSHLLDNGAPKYTNRLLLESSPYLLQHAHNPVNWFSWGPEAFALAHTLSRPIFLSVGYSTCHWCHVMEEESFEDEEIAAILNTRYIAIKVDREERPDVDALYMAAVQQLTGRGGWPMSVWLTPERLPFYGGTYFPARDGDRGTRVGFLTLLKQQAERFSTDLADVGIKAQELTQHLERQEAQPRGRGQVDGAPLLRAREAAASHHDPLWGGSRGAPKFPSNFPVRLLLRAYRGGADKRALEMATDTLDKMAAGGLYDHVGGGFHRYSTDQRWLVPHFEKMLYDNAQLVTAFVEAYQLTHNPEYSRVARETLDYVLRDMTAPEGGFYSATDADSLTPSGRREEGYYFTWTRDELASALPADQLDLVNRLYAVSEQGNFEGRNILYTPRSRSEVRRELSLSNAAFEGRLDAARETLRAARARRPAPLRDEKIQVSWNGLMIAALAQAASALNEPRYLVAALRAADFLLGSVRPGGELRHSMTGGQLSQHAFLDDYAFLSAALLDVFEASSQPRYLQAAVTLMDELEERFVDKDGGGYFLTAQDAEPLLIRQKDRADGAVPNGNSVAALSQLRLYSFTTQDRWRQRAERTLSGFSTTLRHQPLSLCVMLIALHYRESQPREIAIVSPTPELAEPLRAVLKRQFLPHKVVVQGSAESLERDLSGLVPWAVSKPARSGKATAYVCEQGACELPTSNPRVFARQLTRAAAGG